MGSANTPSLSKSLRREIFEEVKVLIESTFLCTVSSQDIRIESRTLEIRGELSHAIKNHLWPKMDQSVNFYHFTSLKSATNIIETSSFYLTSILKNKSEGEIITFCKSHGV